MKTRPGSARKSSLRWAREGVMAGALLLGLTGCGIFPEQRPPFPGQEPSASISVDGTESRFLGMTIYINSTAGFRQRLGTLSVGGRDQFIFRNLRPGSHWLEGRAQGTDQIRSRDFILRDGDSIEWDLGTNDIFYR